MGKIRNELFLKHEINSIRNSDLLELIRKQGLDGYAVYWLFLEHLQGTETGTIQEKEIEAIAPTCLQTDAVKAAEIIKTCLEIHLLEYSTDGKIYSPLVVEQRDLIIAKSEQGRNAVKKRWTKEKEETTAETVTDETATDTAAIAAENSPYATLCKEICDKFGVKVKPIHYEKLSMLLKHLTGNGVMDIEKAAAVVRATLAKLDTAKAIQSGKFKYTINSFFNPKTFTNLYGGDYDEIYQKPHFK